MKRIDVILSAGTLALVLLAAAVIVATGTTDEFAAWAWARHHNELSWYIRPLFLLPFCYFAYKRRLWGIVLTVLALATSMFWFPVPGSVDPQAVEFLAVEREYLTGDWTLTKVLLASFVPVSFAALAVTFWKRSLVWGLAVINAMVLVKIVWSFHFGDTSGGLTLLPSALAGLAVCDAVILYPLCRMRKGSSPKPSRQASQMAARPVGEFCELYADTFCESSPRRWRRFRHTACTEEVQREAACATTAQAPRTLDRLRGLAGSRTAWGQRARRGEMPINKKIADDSRLRKTRLAGLHEVTRR
jgi:hypothetical protein